MINQEVIYAYVKHRWAELNQKQTSSREEQIEKISRMEELNEFLNMLPPVESPKEILVNFSDGQNIGESAVLIACPLCGDLKLKTVEGHQ